MLNIVVKDDGFFKDSNIGTLDLQIGEIVDSGSG
jgi:hypothetical protein